MVEFEPTGLYFEDLERFSPDDVILHLRTKTITEQSNAFFSEGIEERQPLHINKEFAKATQFGQIVINGNQTKGIIESLSVPDLTAGTIVANLESDKVKTPHPVFIGDELSVITHVLSTRPTSKSDRGLAVLEHHGFNQNGDEVISEIRTVLVYRTKRA